MKNIKEAVFNANLLLTNEQLVILTWGNVSFYDRVNNLIFIKPSGIEYDKMSIDDIVVLDPDGNIREGYLKPSSDTPTHLLLYKHFKEINSIVHTHSTYATAWAQAGNPIPIIGTTHADYFCDNIPCTRDMTQKEINKDYEKNTGYVIVETFKDLNPIEVPAVLVKNHGPFTWGKNIKEAVSNSIVLEELAKMATISYSINSEIKMNNHLTSKHYFRKHGKTAYYGQENE